MSYLKYALVFLSVLGFCMFIVFRELSSPSGFCDSVAFDSAWCNGHYLWPIWNLSKSLLLIGLLVLWKPVTTRPVLTLTAIFLPLFLLALLITPELSSDPFFPIEKKSVGAFLSIVYGCVGVILWGWNLRKGKSSTSNSPVVKSDIV